VPLAVAHLSAVTLVREDRRVLDAIDWQVTAGERWVVLGRNGCGKTSLARIVALQLHPSSGTVDVLGERLGRTDVRSLRRRIGFASAALADSFRRELTAVDIVMTGREAALEPWWHPYDDTDRERALAALGRVGIRHLAHRSFGTLSSGERQRVVLARTTSMDPPLVILDEPTAGLDLAGREELVASLDALATAQPTVATVLVTHHVDEIPSSTTHALLLGATGTVVACGAIDAALTADALSSCFELPLSLERRADGRRAAWRRSVS
jgi:iron complex transport system ATP-binding protein